MLAVIACGNILLCIGVSDRPDRPEADDCERQKAKENLSEKTTREDDAASG